ncbi:MAG TPA: glucose-6-phosphate isomerase [Nitrospiria bacterium]|nr:glucose-6-phosphate isomerase [Nitrospiria bacterium]
MTPSRSPEPDRATRPAPHSTQRVSPGRYPESLTRHLIQLQRDGFLANLRQRRTDLWNPDPAHQAVAANRLGWVDPLSLIELHAAQLTDWAREARARHDAFVLLGMGGSSLAPEVIARVAAAPADAARFTMLDSTDPDAIAAIVARTEAGAPLYLVSSKSGGTVETRSHAEFFFAREAALRPDPGRSFVAITDPDSPLARLSRDRKFAHVFLNAPDIGGRYSALSLVGLVPAALLGLAPSTIAERVSAMMAACAPDAPTYENPALVLGALMAVSALNNADKLTLVTSPALAPFAAWVEQLIAESTGKDGRGIIPVAGEALDRVTTGNDRCVVALTLQGDHDPTLTKTLDALRASHTPLVEIVLPDRLAVFGEFYKWEVATAVAASLLKVDPFDEPNVKESKDMTAAILAQVEKTGRLPIGPVAAETDRLAIWSFAPQPSVEAVLRAFFAAVKPPMYVSVLGYLNPGPGVELAIARLRQAIGAARGVPTLFGWGPRYLHSIGQLYKGGPPSGAFLILTTDHAAAQAIPNAPYTFGQLELAQALGDLEALAKHTRPAIRVHLKGDLAAALADLEKAINAALK